jgi:hypothetical protein
MLPKPLPFRRLLVIGVVAVGIVAGAAACTASGPAASMASVTASSAAKTLHTGTCRQQAAAHLVPNSVEAAQQEIIDTEPCLQAAGITIAANDPNPVTGRVNITVLNLTPIKSAVLDRLFGAQNITLSTTKTLPCACDAIPSTPGLVVPSVKAP